ncbi:Uncharacterised protein [Vibrio cholerae]|uniref:Uncharacterized protein n=1 Tax=Vibrio cholerae TaxID=666 RepID=A0A655ZEI5_VIBCL|nr:Uncharacterised protein [Vibrio cholerae]CSB46818.1 Uncharacterised protein [Vibrio cholerae]CSB78039.1 Uncharacterised protein [Vibrio cholerae]CSC18355.1 Uncharacterised protein [Vibrio cholerae]CSC67051.1 Uncharacterised protein [Vibrio cholerae]
MNINVFHQSFFGEDGRFFRRTANTNAEHARWTPARAHQGYGFFYPFRNIIGRIEHHHLGFVFTAAAFGRNLNIHFIARHHIDVHHSWGIVFGIDALARRIHQY